MALVDIYQPDVAVIGHNSALDKGSYTLISHNDTTLNEHIAAPADMLGINFTGNSENANASFSEDASIFPINSLAALYEGNVAAGYAPHTGLLGGTTADWLRHHTGDETLVLAPEIAYFHAQQEERELEDTEKLALLATMNDMIGIASSALEYAHALPYNTFDADTKAYYDASKGPIARFQDRIQQMNKKKPEELSMQDTSSGSLVFVCVAMNSVKQLMQKLGQTEYAAAIEEKMKGAILHIERTLQPEAVPVDKQVKMYLGAVACALLAKKEGRITTENNIMSTERVAPIPQS